MSAGLLFLVGLLLLTLIGASALFSAIETALFSLKPVQIERLKTRNPRLAQSLERLMANPRQLLGGILFADASINLPLIILCLFLMRRVFPTIAPFWISALVIFTIIVLLCDLAPKLIALREPYRIGKVGVAVLRGIVPVLEPALRVLENVSEKIADLVTPAKLQQRHFLSEAELGTLVQLSAEEGTLQASESEMIQDIIKLGDKLVKDCMTPRIDTFSIADDLTNEEAIRLVRENRHRRVPIYADTPDNVLGILDVQTFLLNPASHYTEVMDSPSYVPETMKAIDLLKSFLNHPQGMAVIIDEFGGTEGVITLADIVEEIIGDAAPTNDQELYIEKLGDGRRVIVSGQMRLDDLSELGFRFEAEGVDTISGLIFNRLGYLPKPGTNLRVDDFALTVRRTSRKRVEEVLIERNEPSESGAA